MTAPTPSPMTAAGAGSARRYGPFVVVSRSTTRPLPRSASPSCNTIRRKPNSSKNPWIASIPPFAVTGSGLYVRSSTTTTNPRGVRKLRSSFTKPALVKVFVCSGNAPAVPVMSGFISQTEFHDWNPTTKSACACSSIASGDTGPVAHPATARRTLSKTPKRNIP